jgi:hypothetical protein
MTNIFGVDATSQPWLQDNSRPPAKDFSHELAKHDEQVKPNLQNDAKSNQEAGFENPPQVAGGKQEPVALPGESATMLSANAAEAAAQSEAQQLAQATVTPIGVTEALLGARVFGWHGMAQAYLSELTAADGEAHAHELQDAPSVSSASTPDEEAAAPAANEPVALATTDADHAAPQLQSVGPMQLRAVSEDASSSNIAEVTLADTTASSYWSERSIRFTRQRDGGSVAWLRDFRISDAEASHLIQFVLNDAKAKGMALSKIMLNGREAWTSPNNH